MVKNTEHLVLSEDRETEVFKLSFNNVGMGDAGYYTLVAKNELGDAQQQVHFNVHGEISTTVMVDNWYPAAVLVSGLLATILINVNTYSRLILIFLTYVIA